MRGHLLNCTDDTINDWIVHKIYFLLRPPTNREWQATFDKWVKAVAGICQPGLDQPHARTCSTGQGFAAFPRLSSLYLLFSSTAFFS